MLWKPSSAMAFSREYGSGFGVFADAAQWVAADTTLFQIRETSTKRHHSRPERSTGIACNFVIAF